MRRSNLMVVAMDTLTLEIRQAPIAMKTASSIGNSSGSIDIPTAMSASTPSSQYFQLPSLSQLGKTMPQQFMAKS